MPGGLEDLASWYRELAERAEEPRIWHTRTRTAELLEAEARRIRNEQHIRERAYALWEEEGRPEGRDVTHWLRAEAELAADKSLGVTDDGKLLGASPDAPATLPPRRS